MQLDLFSDFFKVFKSTAQLNGDRKNRKPGKKNNADQGIWNGHSVIVSRKRYRRRMTITVNIDSEIKVAVGATTSQREIKEFLNSHSNWILNCIERQKSLRLSYPKKRFVEGEIFQYLGQNKLLEIRKASGKSDKHEFLDGIIRLYVSAENPNETKVGESLKLIYKKSGREYLTQRINSLSAETGLAPRRLVFRAQKTMWGSCSSQGCVSLNWKLMVAPPEVIDYVILHELCHLKHHNHSKAFWSLVSRYCPRYKEHKKYLESHQLAFEFLK